MIQLRDETRLAAHDRLTLISCVVPVYNGERYLAEALDSILAQSYRPLEIIVADDGSTDGTAGVVASYGDWVRYLWQPNAGAAAARNLGLGVVQGEFVAFLDADDLWHPEKLARQMARFQSRPELDLCVTHVRDFWMPELCRETERLRKHHSKHGLPGYLSTTLLAQRSIFQRVGEFDTAIRHGDSMDWFLRVAEEGSVIELLPDVLVYRRLHRASLTRRLGVGTLEEYLQLVKKSLDRRRRESGGGAKPLGFPGCCQ